MEGQKIELEKKQFHHQLPHCEAAINKAGVFCCRVFIVGSDAIESVSPGMFHSLHRVPECVGGTCMHFRASCEAYLDSCVKCSVPCG